MPVKLERVDGYKVSTPGGTKSKNTSKKKAKAQVRLLNAIDHDPSFTPRGSSHNSRHKAKD